MSGKCIATYLRSQYLCNVFHHFVNRNMQRPVCLADFEKYFYNFLDKNARDYYSHGANQEQTLKDNVEAFMRYVCVYTLC